MLKCDDTADLAAWYFADRLSIAENQSIPVASQNVFAQIGGVYDPPP